MSENSKLNSEMYIVQWPNVGEQQAELQNVYIVQWPNVGEQQAETDHVQHVEGQLCDRS